MRKDRNCSGRQVGSDRDGATRRDVDVFFSSSRRLENETRPRRFDVPVSLDFAISFSRRDTHATQISSIASFEKENAEKREGGGGGIQETIASSAIYYISLSLALLLCPTKLLSLAPAVPPSKRLEFNQR